MDETGGFSTEMLLISASTFLFWLNLEGKLEKDGPVWSLLVETVFRVVETVLTPGMFSWGAPTATLTAHRAIRS